MWDKSQCSSCEDLDAAGVSAGCASPSLQLIRYGAAAAATAAVALTIPDPH